MQTMNWTLRKLLKTAETTLREKGIEDARADVMLLSEHFLGVDRTAYLLHASEKADPGKAEAFLDAVRRRCSGIPVQYITGNAWFMGHSFQVNEHVLIPRQDTEILAEEAVRAIRDAKGGILRVLDLCTGSGCIAVSLALSCPEIECTASDLSKEACRIAMQNAGMLKADRVRIVCRDLFGKEEQAEVFDLIVSNPPYISSGEIEALESEVKDQEPRLALDGGTDGLDFYRRIAREAPAHLRDGGLLMMEIGWDQARAVESLLEANGFSDIRTIQDLAGLDRVVSGRKEQAGSEIPEHSG